MRRIIILVVSHGNVSSNLCRFYVASFAGLQYMFKGRLLLIHTCLYIHAYIHTYIHAYIHTYIHTYKHVIQRTQMKQYTTINTTMRLHKGKQTTTNNINTTTTNYKQTHNSTNTTTTTQQNHKQTKNYDNTIKQHNTTCTEIHDFTQKQPL